MWERRLGLEGWGFWLWFVLVFVFSLFCFVLMKTGFFLCKTLLQDIVCKGCTLFADSLRSQYESLNCEAELCAHHCLSGPE